MYYWFLDNQGPSSLQQLLYLYVSLKEIQKFESMGDHVSKHP